MESKSEGQLEIHEDIKYSEVLDYLKTKNPTLKNDYKTPDGEHSESCTLIACEIAKMILEKGGKPEIISIKGKLLQNGVNRHSLIPRIFGGRISWGAHVVCADDGIIYDPLVGEPLQSKDYLETVFQDEADYEVIVPSEKINEFLNR